MIQIGRKRMRGSDGKDYIVIELEERKPVETMKGIEYIPGMRFLELEDGTEVYSLSNKLTIKGTGVTLTDIE